MYSKNYATINLTKAGVVTKSQIGDIFPIGHEGMTRIRIDLVGTFHAVGTLTFTLQTSPDLVNWVDSKAATTVVGTDATFRTITLLDAVAGDQTYLPLARNCRMVVTATNAGDTVEMTGIFVQQ
jgi:hypothetical protein